EKVVSATESYVWTGGSWVLGKGHSQAAPAKKFKVVAYDFGVKRNILRMLVDRGCDLTVVPAQTPADVVLAMNPDGIFLANGPGEPAPCDYAYEAIKGCWVTDIPVFGICRGDSSLALESREQP